MLRTLLLLGVGVLASGCGPEEPQDHPARTQDLPLTPVTRILEGFHDLHGVAVDCGEVFVVERTTGRVVSVRWDGTSVRARAVAGDRPRELELTPTHYVWLGRDGVFAADRQTDTVTVLARAREGETFYGLAASPTHVHFTAARPGVRTIHRTPLAGGAVETLARETGGNAGGITSAAVFPKVLQFLDGQLVWVVEEGQGLPKSLRVLQDGETTPHILRERQSSSVWALSHAGVFLEWDARQGPLLVSPQSGEAKALGTWDHVIHLLRVRGPVLLGMGTWNQLGGGDATPTDHFVILGRNNAFAPVTFVAHARGSIHSFEQDDRFFYAATGDTVLRGDLPAHWVDQGSPPACAAPQQPL